MPKRAIVCLNVPHFEIAVVRLVDPGLVGRPVAILARRASAVFVADASAEAAAEGITEGLPWDVARRLCPAAAFIEHNGARVRRARQCVWNAVAEIAPVWEPSAGGRVYADLTGTTSLFGPAKDATARLVRALQERHGLAAAAGVGTNKLVTQIGANIAPCGSLHDVPEGTEQAFVQPLPPAVLPQSQRPSWRPVFSLLEDLNLRSLGMIAAVPLHQLHAVVGPPAEVLHRSALGLDERPVRPAADRPMVSLHAALGHGEIEPRRIAGAAHALIEELCCGLRRRHRGCAAIRLTAVFTDHAEAAATYRPRAASCPQTDFRCAVDRLVLRCIARRMRVRAIIVEARTAVQASEQLSLLHVASAHGPAVSRLSLLPALDAIHDRFGAPAIRWGRTVP